jgi:cytochrome c oxidase assembly protein subunit 11
MNDTVQKTDTDKSSKHKNARLAFSCFAFFTGMLCLAYASVPLYNLFCKVTGYGGTTQRSEIASQTILDKTINVRFDSNIGDSALGWKFKPLQREVTIKIGEQKQIAYSAENTLSVPTTGTATFNVTPQAAGAYFNKMECFCFTETTLQPGESMEMPVVFFIDPEIVNAVETKNIGTITLSYTFYEVDEPAQISAVSAGKNQSVETLAPTEKPSTKTPKLGDEESDIAGNRG